MNNLQVITEREILGQEFKIYGDSENSLFLAKDVAMLIEHSDVSTMLRTVNEDEKLTQTMFVSGQNRDCWFLTEDGLYEVLLQSRKPIAKEFKKQVKQILHEIRRHGVYATPQTLDAMLADPDLAIRLFSELKTERMKVVALKEKVAEDKPRVLFANAVEASHTSILIGDLAKILKQNGREIGQNRLFEWLRGNGYLMKFGERHNMPTQRSMEAGLFEVKESTINNPDGSVRITKTTKVTGKGQVYFVNLLAPAQMSL